MAETKLTNGTSTESSKDSLKQSDKDGQFRRQDAQFRNSISKDPNAPFPAEKDRYVIYLNYVCPWAHRANLVRSLKGLEDVIQLVVMGYWLKPGVGWVFDGKDGTAEKDPLYGFTELRQLYFKANPNYTGRYTVPTLWDKKKETVVSNESSEIIRMLYTEFDEFVPDALKESSKPLLPSKLKDEIEAMNEWVYDTVNNGVYKTGFASTQEAYESNLYPLFKSLDRLEEHLSQPGHSPFLFGEHVTEADIRLYTTLIRFDIAYHSSFKCNLKMIRHDYPKLDKWLRTLYWHKGPETNGGAFGSTTHFEMCKKGYALVKSDPVVPAGPLPHILPLES